MKTAPLPPSVPAIVSAIARVARQLSLSGDWRESAPDALRTLGEALGASRVVLSALEGPDAAPRCRRIFEWPPPGVQPPAEAEDHEGSTPDPSIALWRGTLLQGRPVFGTTEGWPEGERRALGGSRVRSWVLLPVRPRDTLWGFLGLEDCLNERDWEPHAEVLQGAADILAAALGWEDAASELRAREERFRYLSEAAVEGIVLHEEGRILHVNQRLADMLHVAVEELVGMSVFDLTPDPHHARMRERLGSTSEEPYEIEVRRSDGTSIPVELVPRALEHQGRRVRVVAVRDVSERRRAEETRLQVVREQAARQAAEIGERRAAFLAEASRLLGSSFDYQATLGSFARLTVPILADFSAIDLLEDEESARRVAVAHVDPDKETFFRNRARVETGRLSPDDPGFAVLREGRSILLSEIDPAMLAESLASSITDAEERQAFLAELDAVSLILVPLRVGLRSIGIATLVRSGGNERYGPDDLALAEELARRASLAIDNARLFAHAQQATRDRDRMLAVVAHDLRNPLSAMALAADVVEATLPDGGTEGQRRQLRTIRGSAGRMHRLIQDLLEVVRIQEGRLTIRTSREDPGAILLEAYESHLPLAEQKGVALTLDRPGTLPWVTVDSARIHQALANLVGNAIKFTPAGGRVTLSVDGGVGEIGFAVADDGPGIPADQMGHLFSPFWQGDRRDPRGIGLGLGITQGIVEAHGGRIWVESRVGRGTTVSFTLPVSPGVGDEEQSE